jgi:HJR/Mrr/RecB family endonuclease
MFRPGEHYTHEEIYRTLSVGNAGGIRIGTNSDGTVRRIVLLTSVPTARITKENPYHDRVEGDVLVYTGAGQEGDQALGGPNKRLIEQTTQPFPVYGFLLTRGRKKSGPRRWRFLGMLAYLRHYREMQIDVRKTGRSVWIFEFRVLADFDTVAPDFDAQLMAGLISEQEKTNAVTDDDAVIEDVPSSILVQDTNANAVELEKIRRRMLSLEPRQFEHLIRDVLVWSGFCNVYVTKYSQDGGIDVNALAGHRMWPIRDLLVQVQAKRWLHTVGRKEVAELRGSLLPNSRGALVTTSQFSRAAIKEAVDLGKNPIILVDGFEFAKIVAHSGIGVS